MNNKRQVLGDKQKQIINANLRKLYQQQSINHKIHQERKIKSRFSEKFELPKLILNDTIINPEYLTLIKNYNS